MDFYKRSGGADGFFDSLSKAMSEHYIIATIIVIILIVIVLQFMGLMPNLGIMNAIFGERFMPTVTARNQVVSLSGSEAMTSCPTAMNPEENAHMWMLGNAEGMTSAALHQSEGELSRRLRGF